MAGSKRILFTAFAAVIATAFIAIVPALVLHVLFGPAGHGLAYYLVVCGVLLPPITYSFFRYLEIEQRMRELELNDRIR